MVIPVLLLVLFLYLNNSKDRAEDNEKGGTKITSNTGESDAVSNNSYKTLNTQYFLYDSEGMVILDDLGDFLLNDKYIKCSLDIMNPSNERQTNGVLMVFIGGIQQSFIVNNQECMEYRFVQESDFKTMKLDITIPIDNIQEAYDNNVYLIYMVYDNGAPDENGNHRLMDVESFKARINDLNVKEMDNSNVDIITFGDDSSWKNTQEHLIISSSEYDDVDPFNDFISKDKENISIYMNGKTDCEYIVYYFIDGVLQNEHFKCGKTDDNSLYKMKINIGEDAESIMAFCVPLNNIEKNIFNTINIYGVYK